MPFRGGQVAQGAEDINRPKQRQFEEAEKDQPVNGRASQEHHAPALPPGENRKRQLPGQDQVLTQAEKKHVRADGRLLILQNLLGHSKRRMQGKPQRHAAPPIGDLQLVQGAGDHDDGEMHLHQSQGYVGSITRFLAVARLAAQ